MKQWLNYHHLYYFKTIATEGSIVKAAKRLRLGQPTLSTQLKIFEDHIGHKLFDREARTLKLTEAGQMVLDYANEIFKLGDEMVEAINDRLTSNRVDVTIGALDSVPKSVLMMIAGFAQETADCRVSFLEGRYEELLREVKAHRIDIIVANHGPTPAEATGLRTRRVARMSCVICGDQKFSHLKRGYPDSLSGQPFILPTPHSKLRMDMDHWFKTKKISADVVFETQDTSLQKLLVTHHLGLAPLPEPAAKELIKEKALVMLGPVDDVYEELWLLSGERRIQNPVAAQIFKSFSLDSKD